MIKEKRPAKLAAKGGDPMAKKNYAPIVVSGVRPIAPQRCHLPKLWNAKNWNANISVKFKKPLLPWKKRELERVVDMVEAIPGWHRCILTLYLLEVKWAATNVVYLG